MKKIKPSQITFRLPDDLRSELERIAEGEERSLSRQVVFALKYFVQEYKIQGKTKAISAQSEQ